MSDAQLRRQMNELTIQNQMLQTQCSTLEVSEQAAAMAKKTAERNLVDARRTLQAQARDHKAALAAAKRQVPPLEEENSRLNREMMAQRLANQEEMAALDTKSRTLQRKLAAAQNANRELQHTINAREHVIGIMEGETPVWEAQVRSLEKHLHAANTDDHVRALEAECERLSQQLAATQKTVGGHYEESVLAKTQAEMYAREKAAMASKMATTTTEIEALRASWMTCVEETREVRAQNEALYAHNNRLELEYANISIQLEEAMGEAAKSQVKMMEILRDTTGLRKARDQAYGELQLSGQEKATLKADCDSMLENLKDAYMEVDRRKADIHRVSEKMQKASLALEDMATQKHKVQRQMSEGFKAREDKILAIESTNQDLTTKFGKATESLVDAQHQWGAAERNLDDLRTEVVEFEQMAASMQDYVGDMHEYQERTACDLDTIYAVSNVSQFLSSKGSSQNGEERLRATRYIHGPHMDAMKQSHPFRSRGA